MNQSQWDEKLKSFLKKTGEDVKRAGNDIKAEAEKLLKEVQDPERQAKVRAGVKDFSGWARKTAEEMAGLMETGVKKAEVALNKATDKVVDFTVGKPGQTRSEPVSAPDPTPPDAPSSEPRHPPAEPKAAKVAKKSIGGKKRKPAAKKTAAKKSLGKAAPAAAEDDE